MSPATCHSSPRRASLRPFSNQLAAYTAYLMVVQKARSTARTFNALAGALRRFPSFRTARLAATNELQHIYDHVAFGLRLPKLPVRLPLRKRSYNRGAAVTYSNGRFEIRVWVFHSPPKKKHHEWQPADIGISTPPCVCEVLLHEIAHIHQTYFTPVSDHEHGFVRSYEIVEEVFLGFGFGPLLPDKLRFAGCPPGAFAASLLGTSRQSKSLAIG
ncbi:MAG: hypothetical protein JHC52_11195 [Chthoniobacterales bacterium]|nr:hypothetical protein [Chthoniobacterales bacterium]